MAWAGQLDGSVNNLVFRWSYRVQSRYIVTDIYIENVEHWSSDIVTIKAMMILLSIELSDYRSTGSAPQIHVRMMMICMYYNLRK